MPAIAVRDGPISGPADMQTAAAPNKGAAAPDPPEVEDEQDETPTTWEGLGVCPALCEVRTLGSTACMSLSSQTPPRPLLRRPQQTQAQTQTQMQMQT